MAFDDKANLTVIHHIGAGREGAGTVLGSGNLERGGRHVLDVGEPANAGKPADDAAGRDIACE